MAPTTDFRGVFPILATPFHEDESVDLDSVRRLVAFMAHIGVDGVTVLGVLGESNRMTDRDREAIVRAAVEASDGLPVIVGTSHPGTNATIELSQMAQELGAAAVMVAPSSEPIPSDDRVLDYFTRVGAALEIPVVAQDHPASTQVHMPVPLLLRLIEAVPAIACLKEEGVPTPARVASLRRGMQRQVPVLTGLGALYALFDLEQGSAGFNTGFAFPEVLMAMTRAADAGDWPTARDLYARFLPLIVFEQQPGVAIRKEILRRRGLIQGARVRHPGGGLIPETAEQLTRLLDWTLPGVDLTQPLILGAPVA
ncbi:MAG: dihydrodipicolinate synthase family protein [Chloroflexi bacterium]|nr:dihydrodipicolinate synthase family protein [Chloroflexota bacterium]